MGGWFEETGDERRKRLDDERKTVERKKLRNEQIIKRRKNKAEFQKRIDAEVEKHVIANSPEAKQARLQQLHGSSSLLNAALGLEFAVKGQKTAVPWMNCPGMVLDLSQSNDKDKKKDDSKAEPTTKAAAPEKIVSAPRLNRPY